MALSSTRRNSLPVSLPIVSYFAGLIFILIAERVLSTSDAARISFTVLGLVALAGSVGVRFARTARASGDRKRVEQVMLVLALVGFVGALVALATTTTGESLLGIANLPSEKKGHVEAVLTIVWVTLLVLATAPLLSAERALAPMHRAEHIEAGRVIAASLSGLTLGLACAYGALFTYASGELDAKIDFSYFRTARAGDSTRNIVTSLTEPVTVTAFFPQLNDVGGEVMGYLRDLAKANPQLQVEQKDRVLAPKLAREAKINQDGVILVSRGKHRDNLIIGTNMSISRAKLKTLDADFQKMLLQTIRPPKVAYLTVGHGEPDEHTPDARSINGIYKLLESQSFHVKELGLTQGLGSDIPNDAEIVLVLAPSQQFEKGEVESLHRYANRGGHLLMALDPDARIDLNDLAGVAGVSVGKGILANEKVHLRRRYNDSDNAIIVTNHYSSHASVSTLSRNSSRAPAFFPGAAALDTAPGVDSALKIDFAVKTLPETFEDLNGNFHADPGEQRRSYNVVAAVSKEIAPHGPDGAIAGPAPIKGKPIEMRAFVLGDYDVFSDAALQSEVNQLLFTDAIRWLGGEESFMGSISSAEDVRIEHTKEKDQVWFYATILGVPSLVMGLGYWLTRRQGSRVPAEAKS